MEPGKELMPDKNNVINNDTVVNQTPTAPVVPYGFLFINTGSTTPEELLTYAKTL